MFRERLVEAHPFFGVAAEQALQLRTAAPIICWLVPVVLLLLHLYIRVLDSCTQTLARSASVLCAAFFSLAS